MSGARLQKKNRTRSVKTLLGVLFSFLTGLKSRLVFLALSILLYTIFATVQPIIIQQAINLLLTETESEIFLYLVIGFFLITLLVWITQSLVSWLNAGLNARLVERIRGQTFQILIRADMKYHHTNTSGDVTNRLVADAREITNGLNIFTTSSSQILLVISSFVVLLYINIYFALIALVGVPLAIYLSRLFGALGRKRSLGARQSYGVLSGKMAESISGIGVYKTFNQESKAQSVFENLTYGAYDRIKELLKVSVLVAPTISMISTILVFGILMVGGYMFSVQGITSITIDIIFLGVIMTQRFLQPITTISQSYTQFQTSLASLDRVTDILEFENTVNDGQITSAVTQGSISFHNVSFAYKLDTQVLKDISFEVATGEVVALIGHTGAGKSTIASLMHRFYDPTSGSIMVDGHSLTDMSIAEINNTVGLVTQEPYIFADTIIENIRYGRPNASDDEVVELCKLLGAHEFIEILRDGYDTVVDEGGKSLSVGQRQMITIARVFLTDPKIVILDEATSRLDAYTEAIIQQAQQKLFEGRTTIIIAHRLTTIQNVDRILLLEEGNLIGDGRHEELIQSNEKYIELYNLYYGNNLAIAK